MSNTELFFVRTKSIYYENMLTNIIHVIIYNYKPRSSIKVWILHTILSSMHSTSVSLIVKIKLQIVKYMYDKQNNKIYKDTIKFI